MCICGSHHIGLISELSSCVKIRKRNYEYLLKSLKIGAAHQAMLGQLTGDVQLDFLYETAWQGRRV